MDVQLCFMFGCLLITVIHSPPWQGTVGEDLGEFYPEYMLPGFCSSGPRSSGDSVGWEQG